MSNHSNIDFDASNWIPGTWSEDNYFKLDFDSILEDTTNNKQYTFVDNGTVNAHAFVDPAIDSFLSLHTFDKRETVFLPLSNTKVRKLQNSATRKMLCEFAVPYLVFAPDKTRHIMVIKWQTSFIKDRRPSFAFCEDNYWYYSFRLPDNIKINKENKEQIEELAHAAMSLTEQQRVRIDQEIAEQENSKKRAKFIDMLTPDYIRKKASEIQAIETNPASYIENAFSLTSQSQSPSQLPSPSPSQLPSQSGDGSR